MKCKEHIGSHSIVSVAPLPRGCAPPAASGHLLGYVAAPTEPWLAQSMRILTAPCQSWLSLAPPRLLS